MKVDVVPPYKFRKAGSQIGYTCNPSCITTSQDMALLPTEGQIYIYAGIHSLVPLLVKSTSPPPRFPSLPCSFPFHPKDDSVAVIFTDYVIYAYSP